MSKRRWLTALIAAVVFAAPARGSEPLSKGAQSTYTMDVRLDVRRNVIVGKEVLTWTNTSPDPVGELWFHLYWNAFKHKDTTLLREALKANPALLSGWRDQDRGSCEVVSLDWIPAPPGERIELMNAIRYRQPDDDNPQDQTVFSIALPEALPPGQTLKLEIGFESKVPSPVYNAGVFRDFYFICQWFPKVGVLLDGQWNCHQHHYSSEYFSEYSTYDVKITLPDHFIVGATGKRLNKTMHSDGTATHRFCQPGVHDFAWTASPLFVETSEDYEFVPGRRTEIHLLLQPHHRHLRDRYLNALKAALSYCAQTLGPYPYPTITCVDPVRNCRCSGMEYPTLFTGGAYFIAPRGGTAPENVTIHEFVHNYFYGIVGTNEFEHAWMDEGMTSFYDSEVFFTAYGEPLFSRRYFGLPVLFSDVRVPIESEGMIYYVQAPDRDDLEQLSWQYFDSKSYTANVYGKGELLMRTLQRMMGRKAFGRMMKSYVEEWSGKHPTPDDFRRLVREHASADVSGLLEQALGSTAILDYAVEDIRSRSVPSSSGSPGSGVGAKEKTVAFESEVIVRLVGSLTCPVDVLITFQDGERVRESWDGRSPWKRFIHTRTSPAVSAVVDPEFKLVLDMNRANNSRVTKPVRLGPRKWALRWLLWLQHALETFSVFAG